MDEFALLLRNWVDSEMFRYQSYKPVFSYPFKKVLLQLSILSQLFKAAVFLAGHRITMSLQIPAYNLYVAILFGIGISQSPVIQNLLSFINLYKKVLYKVFVSYQFWVHRNERSDTAVPLPYNRSR